jgi:hypothetical protein
VAPAAIAAYEVDWLDEPQRDAETPLAWTTTPDETCAAESVASQVQPRPRARLPRAPILAAAAALVLIAGGWLVRLGSSASGAEPAAMTGAIAPTARRPAAQPPDATRSKLTAIDTPSAAGPAPSAPASNAAPARAAAPAPPSQETAGPEPVAELDEPEDELDGSGHARSDRNDKIALANRNVGEGNRLFKRGQLGLAEAAYLKALAALPGYPRAMAALARVHLKRKDGSEAVRWAERLVARQPRRGNNQLLLGDAWALRGNDARARAAWQRAASYGNAAARKRLK